MFKIRNNPYVRYPSPWDSYVTLPFSVPLSEGLSKTKITPNQITGLSFVIALVAVWSFYVGTPWMLVLGGVLYQISYIFDCCDGYVARKTGQSSDLGYWLDHILDELKLVLLVIALVYGQQHLGHIAGTTLTLSWIMAALYVYTRVFAKGDLLIKETIAWHSKKPAADAGAEPKAEVPLINGMVLTPFQAKLYKKFAIVIPWSVIESQAVVFCVAPIVQLPMIGLFVTLVLTVLWHLYMDVFRYWRNNA
ncbi:MAG: CDP-alcohol phosphatidyltransferase family protein [Tumebacillaceae bacterium]